MAVTTVSEAKAQLSALLRRVEEGEEVIISRGGKPIARLVPVDRSARSRRPGALAGRIRIAPDFDELPDDLAETFGAGAK